MTKWSEVEPLAFRPIGVVRSPFTERVTAPRQPASRWETPGTIELFADPRFEHALTDLDGFSHIWVIFAFDRNADWRPKVLPPRSERRRGVFATRSPHRPNAIGLSVVELERVDGCTLHVRGVDMLDGSPVLDLKPYVPYADAIVESSSGWLGAADPMPTWEVRLSERASEQLRYLKHAFGLELEAELVDRLSLGPEPHPYRRIQKVGEAFRIAVREWRAGFRVEGRSIVVTEIESGFRKADAPEPHRAFRERFRA